MARAASKRAPVKAEVASVRAAFGVGLLLALAIPRVLRMLYPELWVEDDFYLEAAWLVHAGMRPYLDFVHPHFPLLEFVSAAWIGIFGASHFSIEILNEASIYATSLLTFKLGARAGSRRAATSAAILYACSSLVFRYHVYERECFVAPLIMLAALLALDDARPGFQRVGGQIAALTGACLIKLTAGIAVAAILAFVAIARRRLREAILIAAGVGLAMILATVICYILYGREFLFQVFIFHFMKGRIDFTSVLAYPLAVLDIQIPLFVIGLIAVRRAAGKTLAIPLTLMIIAADYLFYGVLSPTSWAHNFLEPLPFVAIIGGIGVDRIIEQANAQALMPLGASLAFIIISLIWIAPLENENWLQGSVYGFGFVPRAEVSRIGAALREASGADRDVLAPAFICFQANRRELIRFPEEYGVLREAEAEFAQDGFAATREHLGGENFFQLLADTAHFWREPIIESIRDGKLDAIIPDSSIQLLPLVTPPLLQPPPYPELLVDNGFKPAAQTDHFVLWKREGTVHELRPIR